MIAQCLAMYITTIKSLKSNAVQGCINMTRAVEHVSALIWEENKVYTEIENKVLPCCSGIR